MTSDDDARLREIFLGVSTATLTTALMKQGLRNAYMQEVQPLPGGASRMAGRAFTLRFIPAREDLDQISVFEDPRHPQRLAVETIPAGRVMVIDARGDPRAASAGDILVLRMKMRGAAGIVTDGGLRDSAGIAAMGFPAYCRRPSAPTNLIHHHAVDIDVPIACGGVAVYPGDWIVGDQEGVVVVPADLAPAIAAEAARMTEFETYVEEQVAAGETIIGLYPPSPETRQRFEAWKKQRG